MLVRLNLATKRITRAEAQQQIGQLIGEYPDNLGLRLSAAVVAGTAECSEDVIADLRQLDREYPGNLDIQESLGIALLRIPQARVEAWEQFRSVLSRRPLASSARAAAYSLGKEVAPIEASEALNGSGAVTRFLIRTRARGGWIRALLAPLLVGVIVGAFTSPSRTDSPLRRHPRRSMARRFELRGLLLEVRKGGVGRRPLCVGALCV